MNNEIKLPTEKEIIQAVKLLARQSTAPDAETPDWMEADIERGVKWMLWKIKDLNQNNLK